MQLGVSKTCILLLLSLMGCESSDSRKAREALEGIRDSAPTGDLSLVSMWFDPADEYLRLFGNKQTRHSLHTETAALLREHWQVTSKKLIEVAIERKCEISARGMMEVLSSSDAQLASSWKDLKASFDEVCTPWKAEREQQRQTKDQAERQLAITLVTGQVLIDWNNAVLGLGDNVFELPGDPCVARTLEPLVGKGTLIVVDTATLDPHVRDAAAAFLTVATSLEYTRVQLKPDSRPRTSALGAAVRALQDPPSVQVPTGLKLAITLQRDGKRQNWTATGVVPMRKNERVDQFSRMSRLGPLWEAACAELALALR